MEIMHLIMIGVPILALIVIGVIFSRLYTRSTKELSFVKTGFGGQKVIMNGGALVLPVLHEIIKVNMNTIKLVVARSEGQSLITKDRMRVDVITEFYVRVKPEANSIANAAQTLGSKTLQVNQLKDLVEGKFVDALRSVAAEMTMEQLHEERSDFVQKVQKAVSEDLLKNGMELETVSLTGLDQTPKEYFDPNNAFDAEGLTKLTESIEARKKLRNDIEKDTSVQIKKKDLETEKVSLGISKESEYARMEQKKEIEVRTASENAEIAKEQSAKRKEAETADILANQEIQSATIVADKKLEEEAIAKAQAIDTASILKEKAIQIENQDKAIAISEKSKEESEMNAQAEKARGLAVKASEEVLSIKATEVANRSKSIEIIKATEIAEKDAIAIKVSAQAEKDAAKDNAEAITITANAEAEKVKIAAKGLSDAEILKAEAQAITYEVEAKGKREINAADNLISAEIIKMRVQTHTIEHLATIISEVVKPMENIDSIKVVNVEGINGKSGSSTGGGSGTGTGGSLAESITNSALAYRTQLPVIENILADIGLDANSINGFTQPLAAAMTKEASAVEEKLEDEAPIEKDASISGPIEEEVQVYGEVSDDVSDAFGDDDLL